jgi:peptidylprolyl isomerase
MTKSFLFHPHAAIAALPLLAALGAPACKSHGGSTAADAGAHLAGASAAAASVLPAPSDVAKPPANALRTASGLTSKILIAGTGTTHPGQNDSVKVNYTGWTSDGKMFDSSVAPPQPGRKAEPIVASLDRTFPGWTEGLQLMVVGEKRRFWIPEELAFGGRRGAPAGTVVFDIELLGITPGPKPPDDVAAAPADAERTKDGLASKVTQKGTGEAHPQANDGLRVTYSMWQPDGKLLDASDTPAVRPVSGFSDGWTEGVKLMVVGEKRTLWVPSSLMAPARPGTPTDVTMVVDLLEILSAPKTPADVKTPPRNAIFEQDGLATKVMSKGTGTVHPTATDQVSVHYAGWTTDGNLFDSSYSRGQPAVFRVGSIVPGWSEALQRMVEGEKRRVWIPEKLAFRGQPQRPQGMIVLDLELLKIVTAPQPPGLTEGMGSGVKGAPPVPSHP